MNYAPAPHPKQDMISLRNQVKNDLVRVTGKLARIDKRIQSIPLSDLSQQIQTLRDTLVLDDLDVTKPVPGGQQTVAIYTIIQGQLDRFNELYIPIDEAIRILEQGRESSLLAFPSEPALDAMPDYMVSYKKAASAEPVSLHLPTRHSAFQQACDDALKNLEAGNFIGVFSGILQASHADYLALVGEAQ